VCALLFSAAVRRCGNNLTLMDVIEVIVGHQQVVPFLSGLFENHSKDPQVVCHRNITRSHVERIEDAV